MHSAGGGSNNKCNGNQILNESETTKALCHVDGCASNGQRATSIYKSYGRSCSHRPKSPVFNNRISFSPPNSKNVQGNMRLGQFECSIRMKYVDAFSIIIELISNIYSLCKSFSFGQYFLTLNVSTQYKRYRN